MVRVLEKTERRLGEKLFLKGERCLGPKCAQIRRNYAPGPHGKARRRGLSEYGQLMREKQKLRFLYGLDDREVESYSKKAAPKIGIFTTNFLKLIEGRLDNVVFRVGFADSRRIARQLVNHGHIAVNGKTVDIASCQIKKGDIISIKERSVPLPMFANLENKFKKYDPPRWVNLEKNKKIATIISQPEAETDEIGVDIMKVKEFYSR